MSKAVAALLTRAMQAAGLTQAALARRLQITDAAVTQTLAAGAGLTIRRLQRYLQACGQELWLGLRPLDAPPVVAITVRCQCGATPQVLTFGYGDPDQPTPLQAELRVWACARCWRPGKVGDTPK